LTVKNQTGEWFDWRLNPISGRTEPPKLDWLISYLWKLRTTGIAHEIVMRHAFQIYAWCDELRLQNDLTTHKIGEKPAGNFYATHGISKIGPAKELARLERAAKSGNFKQWLRAWAATPTRTIRLVYKGRRPEWALSFSASGGGYTVVAPRAVDALPSIRRSIKELRQVAVAKKRQRQIDPILSAATNAFVEAFREITGLEATAGYDNSQRGRRSRFVRMVQEIEDGLNRLDRAHALRAPVAFNPARPMRLLSRGLADRLARLRSKKKADKTAVHPP
jgi:hypothetical protein